jgi:polyferredoxin
MLNTVAADVILLVHFAFVLFVTGGLAAIWAGAALHRRWVRNFTFRSVHLAAICIVAAEAIAGIVCPLTLWEDALRGRSDELGFVARWVRRFLFYELPEWVFTMAYLGFAGVVLLTLWLVPPERKQKKRGA